jgi:hypothetical protein
MLLQTYHYRIKDSSGVAWLNAAAESVNYVWNYCNNTASHALKRDGKWLTGFDLNNLTAGTSKELGLAATTIQAVCEQYAIRRRQFRKVRLKYRGKKSLAWVPGGPKGFEGLGIREWVCSSCTRLHDRDINAAINILRLGYQTLALK